MSDERDRLYKIYLADLDEKGPSGTNPCPCDFHQGRWSTSSGKTSSRSATPGVQLTGNGCLASGANPPPLQGLAAWMPQPRTSIWDPYTPRPHVQDFATAKSAKAHAKTGYNCIRCNFKNDYACANHGPDTYLCFNCR